MDSANKQTAVIAEATVGTTPATPAFLLARDIRVSGAPQRPNTRSPERRSDRQAAAMVQGVATYPKQIEMPWVRDAASDVLWASLFCSPWVSNVLKVGSVRTGTTFTLEEKYEGGATDPYRRLTGCMVDNVSISFQNGNPGQLNFSLLALGESTATTAIASSTYAAPTPAYDPSTPADIAVNSLFGLASPKVRSLQLQISNNLQQQYAFGSADPFAIGLGEFNVQGVVEVYFNALADYSAFVVKQTGQTFDITIGATMNFKDRLVLGNCDVFNPNVDDPGQTGVHAVTLNFLGKYYATDASAMKLTRNAP